MRVFQHVDEFKQGDGIGNDIEGIRLLTENIGYNSFVICNKTNFVFNDKILNSSNKLNFSTDDIHILHYGGSGYPIQKFLDLPGRKLLRFHNVTPSVFFEKLNSYKAMQLNEMKAIFELSTMKQNLELVLCDSEFNKETLVKLNYKKLKVIPIVKKYDEIKLKDNKSGFNIGFVGRIVPNKKIEDLFFLLHFLLKIDPHYSLHLIGKSIQAFSDYDSYLKKISIEMDLKKNIFIKEDLNDSELKKEFSELDFYISMSEHEGFGIPILEAYGAMIPVIAYKSTAIHETMGNSGLLFNKKKFELIAEIIDYLRKNIETKNQIVNLQKKALSFYNDFPFKEVFTEILKSK